MQPDPCLQQLIVCVLLHGTLPFATGFFDLWLATTNVVCAGLYDS